MKDLNLGMFYFFFLFWSCPGGKGCSRLGTSGQFLCMVRGAKGTLGIVLIFWVGGIGVCLWRFLMFGNLVIDFSMGLRNNLPILLRFS